MKNFRRQNPTKENISPLRGTPESEKGFYTQPAGQAPLNAFSDESERNTSSTSLHSPARRRENNNRAGKREILLLLFRTGLVISLLIAGFFALKFGLGKLEEPSEKDKEKWIANAEILEKATASEQQTEDVESPTDVTTELISKRVRRWKEAERHMRAAEMREQDGLDEEAAKRLAQVLHSAPDHYAAQKLLMEVHMRSGAYADAVYLCLRLLDQDSKRWGVKMSLLQALQRLGKAEACLSVAYPMMEKEPNNMPLLEVAASAQRIAGNDAEALALFSRILHNDRQHPVALAGSGAIYMESKEWQKALPYCLELVRSNPNLERYRTIVHCYAQMKEAGKAVIFMGQAASRYGELNVAVWLKNDTEIFDPIRETVEYRSFADRIVGADSRKASEDIRKLEEEKQADEQQDDGLDLPVQPVEPVLKINR